jgi:DNA-3-methyladenine glycosylase II
MSRTIARFRSPPQVRKIASSTRSLSVELRAVAPFDFDLALRYLQIWPAAVLEKIDGGQYRRAVTLDGRDVLLLLHSIGTIQRPRLVLEVFGAGVDKPIVERAATLVRRTFWLDTDPAPFLEVARTDPVLDKVVQRLHALRPIQIIDPFEAVLWAILGQQINLAFARRLKLALIEMCGSHMKVDGERFGLFPRPAQVIPLDPDLARQRQFSRQKTAYVKGIAAAVHSGQIDFEALRGLPADQAFAALTAIKGVGRWTAEYLLIRALGFRDAIPAADVGLRKAIGLAYAMERTATEEEVRTLSARWAGWRGWAAFYFWLERLLALYGNLTSAPQTTS